ncbi:glutamate 5-kinase [Brevundimonas terrae]|uniref:Glutamate 5-kinase n=1 Tax=Brevundimonas terrae TaxID=363631 RepID=A0ABN0Y188_9CAUL|nr:glutamate 5-kinase [Brevundimonas terrae]
MTLTADIRSDLPSAPASGATSPQAGFDQARKIVLKIGSSLLFDARRKEANRAWLAALAEDIADLRHEGREIIIVSSGAVALGRARIQTDPRKLADKQAAAAVGQSLLMKAWEEALAPHDLMAGQILLTRDDTERRRRWLNARATAQALLAHGIIPVVNENDTVTTEEIRYGDNDRLAARTAQLVQADLLVLLSDVDGLYTADPRRDPDAKHLSVVERLTPEILAMGTGANSDAGVGTGGMATKLAAVQIAGSAGCATLIASGLSRHPIKAVRDGARSTLFHASSTPLAAWKQWIAGSVDPAGSLTLDDGAVRALRAGKSLLPSGVVKLSGRFEKGDSVRLVDLNGSRLGVGLINYPHDDVARIKGQHSDDIEKLIGYRGPSVVVHRNDLVLEP